MTRELLTDPGIKVDPNGCTTGEVLHSWKIGTSFADKDFEGNTPTAIWRNIEQPLKYLRSTVQNFAGEVPILRQGDEGVNLGGGIDRLLKRVTFQPGISADQSAYYKIIIPYNLKDNQIDEVDNDLFEILSAIVRNEVTRNGGVFSDSNGIPGYEKKVTKPGFLKRKLFNKTIEIDLVLPAESLANRAFVAIYQIQVELKEGKKATPSSVTVTVQGPAPVTNEQPAPAAKSEVSAPPAKASTQAAVKPHTIPARDSTLPVTRREALIQEKRALQILPTPPAKKVSPLLHANRPSETVELQRAPMIPLSNRSAGLPAAIDFMNIINKQYTALVDAQKQTATEGTKILAPSDRGYAKTLAPETRKAIGNSAQIAPIKIVRQPDKNTRVFTIRVADIISDSYVIKIKGELNKLADFGLETNINPRVKRHARSIDSGGSYFDNPKINILEITVPRDSAASRVLSMLRVIQMQHLKEQNPDSAQPAGVGRTK